MTKYLYRILCFLLFIFLPGKVVQSKPMSYYYRPLGIQEGLSQSRVQCILNDHKGYLWIGTESGLNCYDRDHLKQYFHSPKDSTSLPTNDITFIAEDSLLNLWVATSAGLCLYNRAKDRFEPLIKNNKYVYVASYLPIEGGILFGASGAIYKYEYTSRQWTTLYMTDNPKLYTTYWKMQRYDKNRVLINAQWYGVYFYHLNTRKLEKINYLPNKNYTCSFIDSSGRLWISAYGNGLFCYQNGAVTHHFTTDNSALTYNVIHDIIEKDNKLWLATDGGGINILSLTDFTFSTIQQIQDDVYSFPTNTIYRLYKDPMNNIWAGSIRSGLIGIKEVYARSFQNVPFGNRYGLSNQTVNVFFQDSDGTIWIGTDGGGINRFDHATNTFTHYPVSKQEKIVSIIEYSEHELLLCSFNKGLFIFNKTNGLMRPFILIDKETNDKACINGFSVNLQRIQDNKIVFSADNIYIYDIAKKEFSIVARKEKDFYRNSPLIISTIKHKTYFADLKSICEYNSLNGKFKAIFQGDLTINDACMDENGVFWLASSSGLASYNPKTCKLHHISTNLFNEVASVIADNQNRIWIGTRHDLYIYSTLTNRFATLGNTDGVMPNEYFFHSMLLSKKGNILVGGTMGMTVIDGNICFNADIKHSVELLDVFLDGLPIAQEEKSTTCIRSIKVPWNFSSLQLKVLLNDKDVFRKNRLKFNISGGNQELIKSNSNSVVINHLPIGEYTITASYYAQSGEWSYPQEILHVIITPPWWKTYWAYGIGSLLLCLIIYMITHVVQKKKRAKQQQEMEKMKDKLYEDKINFLTNISHELRTPLTLVCAPLKRIITHEVPLEDVERQLSPIYKQAYQMKSIIDMTLDVRKLEEGKEILRIALHPLNKWVQEVADRFIREFEAKEIKLDYLLSPEIEEISFDKHKCEFVLSNFLMNALKFSEPHTTTTIITTLSNNKKEVTVSVKDQGIGLSTIDTSTLFSRFSQGDHDKGGNGIGLFYSKSVITHHKGTIGAIENPERSGSIFYYKLPASIIEYKHDEVIIEKSPLNVIPYQTAQPDYSVLKQFSVTIVEDTLDLRIYLKKTLNDFFAHVYVAQDGKEGLSIIKKKLPDLIISDVMMPHMNGFELCRKVKTDLEISHIPIILLTAYHNSQNMYTGYKIGADAFIPKPFEVDGLLALISNQLKLREQIKTRYREDKTVTLQEISFSNADETFLLKLNALIADNLDNPALDVNFIAANMCISRSLLFNKVKALTGVGIINYVNIQRIDKAAVLLTNTSMNITEVSEAVGFSSLRYFSKVFKSIKGTIPSNYNK